jgi:hypothetical protein
MKDPTLTRRDALRGALGLLCAGGAGVALAACDKKPAELSCTDVTGLAPADAQTRTTMEYVDRSTNPAKTCANCGLFKAPPALGQCGGCQILKGPINPKGYCKSWVIKPA